MATLAFNNLPVQEEGLASLAGQVLSDGQGVFRIGAPAFVRRDFCSPGMNLRLHPADWFPYGCGKGGVDERWFACTIKAANPGGPWHEGLAMAVTPDGKTALGLAEAVETLGAQLIGPEMQKRFGKLEFYTKYFDNRNSLPHHLHQGKRPGGPKPKAEAYWFEPCANNHGSHEPLTSMGFNPGTTKEQVRRCLEVWDQRDNGILHLSHLHLMEMGTGFLMPTGVLHGPAGRATFEPQQVSDTFNMYQNKTTDGWLDKGQLLFRDVPPEADIDFMMGLLDWDLNVDQLFFTKHLLRPILDEKRSGDGITDSWVVYGRFGGEHLFSAKRLVIPPGKECEIDDQAVASVVFVNGRGRIGPHEVETPGILRINDLVHDEFVVAHGVKVRIVNTGQCDLIALHTFGPDAHPDMPLAGNE
jgi:hypothetical protein